jgi:PIN domain nuclease of toxin-antitoxin system
VKYLLDTNIWILMVENHQSIPLKMMSTILKSDNYPFYISAISVWEVAKKVSIGKLTLSIPIRDWLVQATRKPFNLFIAACAPFSP